MGARIAQARPAHAKRPSRPEKQTGRTRGPFASVAARDYFVLPPLPIDPLLPVPLELPAVPLEPAEEPVVPPVPPLPTVPLELPPAPVLAPVLPVDPVVDPVVPAPPPLFARSSCSHCCFSRPVIVAQRSMPLEAPELLLMPLPEEPEVVPEAPLLPPAELESLLPVVEPLLPELLEGLVVLEPLLLG
jgi:hypothetical protein